MLADLWVSVYNTSYHYAELTYDTVSPYIDVQYLTWLVWVLYPLLVTFVLPVLILVFLYASAIFLHVYKLRHFMRLQDGFGGSVWDWARRFLSALWYAQGKIWHGFELHGIENIPDTGPALLIYYHGAIPIDFYYVVCKVNLMKNRQIRPVADKFLFKLPGFQLLMNVFGVLPGSVEDGIRLMQQGHILAIAPGGVREAFFSDNYSLVWGNRTGFAKIALTSQVPIIPMFTQNVREGFRSLNWAWFRERYERTRLPIVPIYGMFPVKMRTYLGKPVEYDPNLTPEQLAQKVKLAVESLIREHQQIPGSITRALLERIPFYNHRHKQS